MKKQDEETVGNKDRDRLLARVLEECLDEDLSFVPPEREIARSHTFSESFEEKMDQLLNDGEEAVRKEKERETATFLTAVWTDGSNRTDFSGGRIPGLERKRSVSSGNCFGKCENGNRYGTLLMTRPC